jgi:hypothetical protein
MSLLPQEKLAVYAVQGNDEPLATKSNLATTFNDREGAKAPTVKLIALITTPNHCHGAQKAPVMKLVSLRLSLQQMHWSKTFVSSLREAILIRLRHVTINFVDCRSNNNENR